MILYLISTIDLQESSLLRSSMDQTGVEGIQQDQQSFWMQNVGLTNFFDEQTCARKIIIIKTIKKVMKCFLNSCIGLQNFRKPPSIGSYSKTAP